MYINHWNSDKLPGIGSTIKLVSKDLSISPLGRVPSVRRKDTLKSLVIGSIYEVTDTDIGWNSPGDGVKSVKIKHRIDGTMDETWMVLGDFVSHSVPYSEHSITSEPIKYEALKVDDLVKLIGHHKFPSDDRNHSEDTLKIGEVYQITNLRVFKEGIAIHLRIPGDTRMPWWYPISGFSLVDKHEEPTKREQKDPANMILDPVVKARILSAPLIKIGEVQHVKVPYDSKVTVKKIAHISASQREISI
jgi:hypothetical protein